VAVTSEVLNSDSETEDLVDVITETKNAHKFIVATFDQLRKTQRDNVLMDQSRHKDDQKKWRKFVSITIIFCTRYICTRALRPEFKIISSSIFF